MARGVNKVILVGNIGQDPEVRFMPNGSPVCNISLATTRSWTDRQTGQRQEDTEWHRVVMFNRLAEIAQQYVVKGSRLYIEGRLQTRKWKDKNTGEDRYATEVVANDMQMLGMPDGNQQGGQQRQQSSEGSGTTNQPLQGASKNNTSGPGSFDEFDDEIPF